jgi:hypothetical protein
MVASTVGLALAATPLALGGAPTASAAPTTAPAATATSSRLTNLDHLDFLGDRVAPPTQARHTTYRLSSQPEVGVLWTYADHQDDGSYRRVGGGPYHSDTDTYDQGAFNADDLARAAVVYLRDWRQTGDASSREHAYELLRGLTYLQTASGPNAGNVVLWQQPDGRLNPSPIIKETPDPSDSDASYWLARTVWALGEGYARFQKADPSFASFLKRRLDLAVAALDRQVLDAYGDHMGVDGRRTPKWLVVDGADASAEAVLGLASYARAGGTDRARRVMRQLSNGIAEMAGGDARHWPFGGVLPWALSRSDWHAWSSQMPAALARAGRVLGDRHLRRAAARDSFTFDPWMLTSGGPDNGRLPARADGAQIAYGADSRVQSLMATGGSGGRRMAGLVAAWFFGANASHAPTYDPATGVTFDGVESDGRVNQNSGAESTIHGLLTMLALDAHPGARRIARSATVTDQVGTETLQAEDATLAGGATAVTPKDTWTGESKYAGAGYASLPDGGTATFALGSHPRSLLVPVVDLQHGSSAVTAFRAGRTPLGSVEVGNIGAQGASPAPGALLPRTLRRTVAGTEQSVTATTTATSGDETRLDALLVQPLVSHLVLGGDGHGTALVRSSATERQSTTVTVPGAGTADVWAYDGQGRLLSHRTSSRSDVPVRVAPGGVTLVRR